jgi:hypothetical protein
VELETGFQSGNFKVFTDRPEIFLQSGLVWQRKKEETGITNIVIPVAYIKYGTGFGQERQDGDASGISIWVLRV